LRDIVSTKWLNQNLSNPNLIILDASVKTNANGKEFGKFDRTIPNARLFDLKNTFLDKTSPFPNTIPKLENFQLESRKLGISQDSEIVVFDNNGIYSSPRVWWLFNVMGHQKISVLDGGLPNWIENGFRTEKEHVKPHKMGDFKVKFNETLLVDFEQMANNLTENNFLVVDARSENRFNGTAKEPRKHLRSGKIKNSINIPFQKVLQNGIYKSKKELKQLFEEKCKGEKELVFSCGSGMTASIVMLAGQISYGSNKKIYDGSWTEWAEKNNLKNVV